MFFAELRPKTRGNLARHHHLLHEAKSIGYGHIPQKVVLIFFVNKIDQTLSCPLHYCSYKRHKCTNLGPMATHFTCCHPHHQLCVTYHCQRCNLYISPAERREHNLAHIAQYRFGGPFPYLYPPSTYRTTTYAHSPRTDNTCSNAPDGLVDCVDTQRVPDDASDDAVNISLMANSNGSFDMSPSPPVIPTPSTPLAPSYPSTPSLVPTMISPILPSVDNILAGKTFLPSTPSPTSLDPTPTPPILRNDTGVNADMVSSSPLSKSTKNVIAGLVSLPSQLTPEFLDPTPPEAGLAV